jgi:hypothetical protein
VRRQRLDAIILGTGVPKATGGDEPEATWARRLGYRQVAASPRLVLLVRSGA